jgi:hypothetical protein
MAYKPALILLLTCGAMPAAAGAGDLSNYRGFEFGMSLPAAAKLIGTGAASPKTIHSRPALIQELAWSPRSLGPSSQAESVRDVVFSFYNGDLYQIAVNYDRHEIEGLTTEDIIDAVSLLYGPTVKPAPSAKSAQDLYADEVEMVARWEDPQYGFDLMRSSYGPGFKLVGILKKLDAPAHAAILEAERLDDKEAPQRDAARVTSEQEAARAKLAQTRLVNKPRFRP